MFLADLILLGIYGYNVFLGMEWLTKYYTTIDCKQKTLVLVTTKGESLVYKGSYPNHTIPLISAWFKAWRTTKFCARLPEVVP